MDYDSVNKIDAENAYKKFIKSSKNIFGFSKNKKNLKSFSEVQKEENAYNSVSLGIREVPLKQIVGSVEKYKDFYENFIPKNNIIKERWENIYVACVNEESLPVVILYKIKDKYYVYDGNHRISVAKYLNFISIEAEVKEFLPTHDKKEEIIYRENMIFTKETGIENILFSKPIRYNYLKEEINNYVENTWNCRKDGIEKTLNQEDDFKIICKKWYKNIFIPSTKIIEANDILKYYERSNINDLFYFYLEHKKYLKKNLDKRLGYVYSLVDFINFIKDKNGENIESLFKIFDNEKNIQKLLEEDKNSTKNNLFEEKSLKEKNFEDIEDTLWNVFFSKIISLPERYLEIFDKLKINKSKLYQYILKYFKISNKDSKINFENDVQNLENIILNYIIEVLIPILNIMDEAEINNLKNFEAIQKNYFYLIGLKDELIIESKPFKYETIANKNFIFSKYDIDIKNILLEEKEREFLENILNLKNKEKYLEIIKRYGNIRRYETYIKFFERLDNMGEKRFLQKLEKGLEEARNSRESIKYKTEKSLNIMINEKLFEKQEIINKTALETTLEDEDISFIDFYVVKSD